MDANSHSIFIQETDTEMFWRPLHLPSKFNMAVWKEMATRNNYLIKLDGNVIPYIARQNVLFDLSGCLETCIYRCRTCLEHETLEIACVFWA